MLNIRFSEIILIFIIGLIVLGPQKLFIVVRSSILWIKKIRLLMVNIHHDINKDIKFRKIQESFEKIEDKIKEDQISKEVQSLIKNLYKIVNSLQYGHTNKISKINKKQYITNSNIIGINKKKPSFKDDKD